jgi:hypothetical protein
MVSTKSKQNKPNNEQQDSVSKVIERFNEIADSYAGVLSAQSIYNAFSRAGANLANQPQIQNQRVKSISSLPNDYTKEAIGGFLREPYFNEIPLRQTSQVLKWTAYPYFKVAKTYQDIPTYHHYTKPLYMDAEKAKNSAFLREATLLDKFTKALSPEAVAHKITGLATTLGKVVYIPRFSVDKTHNTVNYAFMQQLPSDWTYLIGFNNVSGYTVSFDMMYFLQPGTDWRQFGDLFAPFVEDFNKVFQPQKEKKSDKLVYASAPTVKNAAGKMIEYYPQNANASGVGNPRTWMQDGRWMYFVTLPIDKAWVFEIDDTTAAVASPLSGLMLTYSQQADYEAAQLSLLLNPLIKIFTGEIPYKKEEFGGSINQFRLSDGGRVMFETLFDMMMARNNTGGTALYSAPLENIKSHDFSESANANEISESFNRYGMEKAGLSGLIPVAEDVKAGQVEKSALLESRFSTATIYAQFSRMMNHIYKSLKLNYDWEFVMFGTIYTDDKIRENAQSALSNGDTSAHFILSALDGSSWIDKMSMMHVINESGILDMLIPPITSYTQSKSDDNVGRPSKSISDVGDGNAGESTEASIDSKGET